MPGPSVSATPKAPAGLPEGLANLGRTAVMGVLNVTPDSFSDGGRYRDAQDAVEHAERLVVQGADLIDVGGESTRPGAQRVAAAEEEDRVLPVVAALAARGIPVSIDTMRASTARAAVERGAVLVNDVSGGCADPDMLPSVAQLHVPVVLMHWRGHSDTMAQRAEYRDVVGEVAAALAERVEAATAAGVAADMIAVDPGLGFAKEVEHNWALLASLAELSPAGLPMLVGASRKRFLGALLADADAPRPADQRDAATAAISTLAAAAGAWCVRVHDVAASADAVRVAAAWRAAAQGDRPVEDR